MGWCQPSLLCRSCLTDPLRCISTFNEIGIIIVQVGGELNQDTKEEPTEKDEKERFVCQGRSDSVTDNTRRQRGCQRMWS